MPETTAQEDTAAAIAAVDRFQAALVKGNFEAVAALLEPDVLILESGGAEYSAAEYLAAHAKSDADFLKSARIEPGRRTARVSGDLAWVASLTEMEIEHEGEPAPEGTTVIRAARLYTAPDRAPIDDAAILVVDGRIAAPGPSAEIASRDAAAFAQCDGGTVVAGFQNSHVHFTDAKFADAASKPAQELIAGGALYPKNGIPIYLNDLPPEILATLSQPGTVAEALASVEANIDGGADATKLFLMTPQGDVRYAFMQPDIAFTTAPAARWKEKARRGVIDVGLDADLVVLEADPAVDAANFAKVRCTIRGGRMIYPIATAGS